MSCFLAAASGASTGNSCVKQRRRLAGRSSADSAHAMTMTHPTATSAEAAKETCCAELLIAAFPVVVLQPLAMQWVRAPASLEAAAVLSAAAPKARLAGRLFGESIIPCDLYYSQYMTIKVEEELRFLDDYWHWFQGDQLVTQQPVLMLQHGQQQSSTW